MMTCVRPSNKEPSKLLTLQQSCGLDGNVDGAKEEEKRKPEDGGAKQEDSNH